MQDAVVTTQDLRKALMGLSLAAAGFVRGTRHSEKRRLLSAAIGQANNCLEAADTPVSLNSAEELIDGYIRAGGDWQKLVAAVQRKSLEGATRRQAA